jgi:hypothetical protein
MGKKQDNKNLVPHSFQSLTLSTLDFFKFLTNLQVKDQNHQAKNEHLMESPLILTGVTSYINREGLPLRTYHWNSFLNFFSHLFVRYKT